MLMTSKVLEPWIYLIEVDIGKGSGLFDKLIAEMVVSSDEVFQFTTVRSVGHS